MSHMPASLIEESNRLLQHTWTPFDADTIRVDAFAGEQRAAQAMPPILRLPPFCVGYR